MTIYVIFCEIRNILCKNHILILNLWSKFAYAIFEKWIFKNFEYFFTIFVISTKQLLAQLRLIFIVKRKLKIRAKDTRLILVTLESCLL